MSKHVPLIVAAIVLLMAGGAIYLGVRQTAPAPETGPAPTAPTSTPTPAQTPDATGPKPTPGLSLEGAKIEQRDPTGQLEWSVVAHGDLEFDKDSQTVVGHQVHFEVANKAEAA